MSHLQNLRKRSLLSGYINDERIFRGNKGIGKSLYPETHVISYDSYDSCDLM